MRLIGVDIGGTATRAGLINLSSTGAAIIERAERATVDASTADSIEQRWVSLVGWISEQVRRLTRNADPQATAPTVLGVAVAGIVDAESGVVVRSVNAPFLEGRALSDALRRSTNLPVHLSTDIAAAAWAEHRAVAPAPARFGHLRFGTGVGYAQIEQNHFLSLPRVPGRHLDALRVQAEGVERRTCPCGSSGCLEAYVSRAALRSMVAASDSGGRERAMAIEATRSVVRRLCGDLGTSGVLVIGGGTLIEHAWLADALLGSDAEPGDGQARVTHATCGDDAGALGAGLLAVEQSRF